MQVLHSGSLNKHVALQITSIYYMWENIREQHKNNKPKIKIAIWKNESELLDSSYSVSDIQSPLILLFIFTSIGLIINQCLK